MQLLIDRYGMHDDHAILPVPIKQVAKEEGWVVCYRGGMGKAIAFGIMVEGVKLIYVNENLTEKTQRLGIAHEMGHDLAGHSVGMDTFMGKRWHQFGLQNVGQIQEEQASLVAAMLLIPEWLLDAPMANDEVAHLCKVPVGAVDLYRGAVPLVGTLRLVG